MVTIIQSLYSFLPRGGKIDGAVNFTFNGMWINFLFGEVSTYFHKNYLETHNFSLTLLSCCYAKAALKKKKSVLQNPKESTKKTLLEQKIHQSRKI